MDTKADVLPSQADRKLQQEFNEWAAAGRGDAMEDHHSDITDQTLTLMKFEATDRVLDLGCGTGWASRRLARLVPEGEVVGIDVADEMLRRAEQASVGVPNVRYLWGSAEKIHVAPLEWLAADVPSCPRETVRELVDRAVQIRISESIITRKLPDDGNTDPSVTVMGESLLVIEPLSVVVASF